MVIVPKKRLIIFVILYFATTFFTIIGYMFIENWSFLDSLWNTVINVVAFGGINLPAELSKSGMLLTVFAKMISLFCVAGIIYSALQSSIFERVDRITYERVRQAREKPINIFISYRRADSSGHTGRIYDRLSSFFGSSHVFMDIDTISPGEDFLRIIHSAISSCEIMVAVIGNNWTGFDGQNKKIFDNNDFVKIEIEYALEKHIQILPVLVNGSRMPSASDIPEDIIALLSQQAIEISDTRWNHDIQKLIDSIDSIRQKKI